MGVYLGSLIFGGVLLGVSVFGGGEHGDHGHDHGHDGHAHDSPLLPFLSLRFWLFALTFFGLTGTAASLLGLGGAVLTPLASGGVGLVSGYGAARLLGGLARRPVGVLAGVDAHLGREGKVLLPIAPGQRGKLRLTIGGASNDFLAETDGDAVLPAGASVLVVGVRGHALLVERRPTDPLLGPVGPANKETT